MKNRRGAFAGLLILLLTLAAGSPCAAQGDGARALTDLVGRVEAKCQELGRQLVDCRAKGQDTALPEGTLAVAEVFCRYSRDDTADPEMRGAAERSMEYVDGLVDGALRRADKVLAGKASYPNIPQWRTVGVTWHDGGFWCDGQPVFLSGFTWDQMVTDTDPALAQRLGITLADGMVRGSQNADGSWDESLLRDVDGPYLARMAQAGFPVDCLLGADVPQWLVDANPGLREPGYGHYHDVVFDNPRAERYRHDFLDHFMPLCAAYPSLFAVDVEAEPTFQAAAPVTMDNWRGWLRRKYGDIAGLNRAWGTSLGSFADVKRFPSEVSPMKSPWDRAGVDFSKPGVRGAHYDWCAFNEERVTEYYRRNVAAIHARAPGVATDIMVMLSSLFTGSTEPRGWKMTLSYHTAGIDAEALAKTCDLVGGDDFCPTDLSTVAKPNRYFGGVPYALGWITAGMAEDFLKSVAPDKPIYNSQLHAIVKGGARDHIRTALWLASLHGMSANLLWYWGRKLDGTVLPYGVQWFKGSLLQQPWALEGYVEETLNLRRFVPEVRAFSREPRRVRLLYSEASAIQDVGYIDALRDAYEALNFLGVNLGFVTERQLAAGGVPADVRVVIVPDARYVKDGTVAALRAACERGVKVAVVGSQSLGCEPTGGRREDADVAGAERIPLGDPQAYRTRFEKLIVAAGVRRELLAIGEDGRPAWGVEVRTASEGGQRLAYLVNLMREPVRVSLKWSSKGARLQDWRTGQSIPARVTLQPRQVIFGAY